MYSPRGNKAFITSLLHLHSLPFQFSYRPFGHTHQPKQDHLHQYYWCPIILTRSLNQKKVQTIWKKNPFIIIELGLWQQTSFSHEHPLSIELDTLQTHGKTKLFQKTSYNSQLFVFHWKSVGSTWIWDSIAEGTGPQITPPPTPSLRTRLPQNQTT